MSDRLRMFVEIALVSAIVGGSAGAIVSRCTRPEQPPPEATTTLNQGELELPAPTPPETPPETPPPAPPIVLAEPEVTESADAAATSAAPEDAGAGELDAGEVAAADAGAEEDAGAPQAEAVAADAGAVPVVKFPLEWGPTFSAGAGRFLTEPPPWNAVSAFTSNPEAGAGTFTTEAPAWGASAWESNPEAGAGTFTTERNTPPVYLLPQP